MDRVALIEQTPARTPASPTIPSTPAFLFGTGPTIQRDLGACALAIQALPAFAGLSDEQLLSVAQAGVPRVLRKGRIWRTEGKVLQQVSFALDHPPVCVGDPKRAVPIVGLRCLLEEQMFPFDLECPPGLDACHLIGFSKGHWFTITQECPSILTKLVPTLRSLP